MIKQLAWNTFKNTGNIDTFMELRKLNEMQNEAGSNDYIKVNNYGDNKDQGNSNFRK